VTVFPEGTSLVTTDPKLILQLFPMLIPFEIVAFTPIQQSFPIVTRPLNLAPAVIKVLSPM